MFAQSQGKIKKPLPSESKSQDDFNQDLHTSVTQILIGLNKGISYGDGTNTSENQNIDGWHSGAVVTPGVASTQFTINHTLGRIPIGYHVIYNDQSGTLTASNTGAWSTTQVFFKWSAGVTTIKVFLF